eukprot:6459024-Amphidinium_carterae.2
MLAITACEIGADIEEHVATSMLQARVTKACGCLMAILSSSDTGKVRSGVIQELREFRTLVGNQQEQKLLPSFLWQVVSNVLKGQQ